MRLDEKSVQFELQAGGTLGRSMSGIAYAIYDGDVDIESDEGIGYAADQFLFWADSVGKTGLSIRLSLFQPDRARVVEWGAGANFYAGIMRAIPSQAAGRTDVDLRSRPLPNPASTSAVPARADTVPAAAPQSGRDEARPLQPEDVLLVVRRETAALRACYERGITVSRAEDRIKVSWVINTNGKPSGVRIEETTVPSPEIEACLTSAIMSWTFRAPADQIEVAFPFVFRTSE